jgi:ELWxxDGT repeat protein
MFADLREGPASTQFGFDFKVAGDYLYFVANTGQTGFEVWRTDETAAGTTLVHDIAPGPASSSRGERTKQGTTRTTSS